MVACVHACMHGPWLSLDLDAPSSLELPRTRKPCSTCDTLAHQTASCSVTVPVATELQACYGDKKLLKGALPCPKPTPMENTRKNSKNSKTLKTLDLGVSLQSTTFPKTKKKILRFRAGPNPCRNDVAFVSEIGPFL
jgi:hypothetical protein